MAIIVFGRSDGVDMMMWMSDTAAKFVIRLYNMLCHMVRSKSNEI